MARHRRRDGTILAVENTAHALPFAAARLVIAQDVTARVQLERELAHRACHDALTG